MALILENLITQIKSLKQSHASCMRRRSPRNSPPSLCRGEGRDKKKVKAESITKITCRCESPRRELSTRELSEGNPVGS